MIKPMQTVAKAFPNQKFGLVDVGPDPIAPNVVSSVTKDWEGSFLVGVDRGEGEQDRHDRLRRRQGYPDHPPLLRRLLLRGEDGEAGGQGARELFGHLHRSGRRQGIHPRPRQPGLGHQLRRRRRDQRRRHRRGQDHEHLRHRRRLRPELHGAGSCADLDGQARRHPGLRHDQVGRRRNLQRRHGPLLRPQGRRRRRGDGRVQQGPHSGRRAEAGRRLQGRRSFRARSSCPTTSTSSPARRRWGRRRLATPPSIANAK